MFYIELFRALEEEKVRYLLVGGLAVNLHGIARFTADVDIMLALDAENLGHCVAAAGTVGPDARCSRKAGRGIRGGLRPPSQNYGRRGAGLPCRDRGYHYVKDGYWKAERRGRHPGLATTSARERLTE